MIHLLLLFLCGCKNISKLAIINQLPGAQHSWLWPDFAFYCLCSSLYICFMRLDCQVDFFSHSSIYIDFYTKQHYFKMWHSEFGNLTNSGKLQPSYVVQRLWMHKTPNLKAGGLQQQPTSGATPTNRKLRLPFTWADQN